MKRIKELRKKKQISGESLGEMVGVQKSAISKYELGRAQPSVEVLVQIANILETSTDYLLGNTDDPTPPNVKKKALPALDTEEGLRIYVEELLGRQATSHEMLIIQGAAKGVIESFRETLNQ